MLVVGFPNSPPKNCPSGGPEKNGMFEREWSDRHVDGIEETTTEDVRPLSSSFARESEYEIWSRKESRTSHLSDISEISGKLTY